MVKADVCLEIRSPRTEDIRGIVTLVRACEPFLTAHHPYIYWKDIRYCGETCAVAQLDGELVGWCSIIPVSAARYFLHQLAVAPKARRLRPSPGERAQSVAGLMVRYLFAKLLDRHTSEFELEFTVDRNNRPALNLIRAFAERNGMQLLKRSDAVDLLEEGCNEELHVMAPDRIKRAG
jgi:hypothetical protein